MAAPPFWAGRHSGLVSPVSGAFFFVLFSLEKSFMRIGQGRRGNRFFNLLNRRGAAVQLHYLL